MRNLKRLRPEQMTTEEKRAAIMEIDPHTGRLVDALCSFLKYEADAEGGLDDPEEYRRQQQLVGEQQLEQLAQDLARTQRRPMGLGIAPNSPDFEKRIRAELRKSGGEKFPARMGFREKPPTKPTEKNGTRAKSTT